MNDGLTPGQRILRARLGGLTTSARGHTVTAPARAAFLSRFEPGDPSLGPAERARRTEAARRLYFAKLALKASKVRTRKTAPVIEPSGAVRGGRRGGVDDPRAE